MQLLREDGVEPNIVTYTPVITVASARALSIPPLTRMARVPALA